MSVRLLEEQGQSLAQSDEGDAASDCEHDGLLHVLVAVAHLEVDVEGADKGDDGGDCLHQIGDRCLVGRDFGGCLGETCGALAGGHHVADGEGYGTECEDSFTGKAGVLEACDGTQTAIFDFLHIELSW